MILERGRFYTSDYIEELDFEQFPKTYGYETNPDTKRREPYYVFNIPCSLDTETTSERDEHGKAVAHVYIYQLNLDGYCFYCRTRAEFQELMLRVSEKAGSTRFIIYVHNLAFDFAFIRHDFNWTTVFSNGKERKVLRALTECGIEFRCSLMLTNQSLANVAKDLTKHSIKKMEGDLDYKLVRGPETPLTDEEMQYNLNDIIIVEYHIREAIEKAGGSIVKIPLTSTGYVREHVRCDTLYQPGTDKLNRNYERLMHELTLESDEYKMLRQAFSGGSVQAQVDNVGKTIANVTGKDLASSYPAVAVTQMFPMGKGSRYDVTSEQDAYRQMATYCCLFYVEFEGLVQKANLPYIPSARVLSVENPVLNNGKVVSATKLSYICTEVDFATIQMVYEWDSVKFGTMYRYKRGYLPTELVHSFLQLYEKKTKFKGIKEKAVEYAESKAKINSAYGMMVQDIIQDDFEWDDEEKKHIKFSAKTLIDEKIERYNKNRNRFLSYAWGVWITAHARHQLFRAAVQLGDDIRYGDTDSLKFVNAEDHLHVFQSENERVEKLIGAASRHHKLPIDLWMPVCPKGVTRMIGAWEDDGLYLRFKTLGAKRYMTEELEGDKKVIHLTVSGVNKKTAVPWMQETYGENIFEAFDRGLQIPIGACGKAIHTYVDERKRGTSVDYLGNEFEYDAMSGIHLEETGYNLTIGSLYADYIEFIQSQTRD